MRSRCLLSLTSLSLMGCFPFRYVIVPVIKAINPSSSITKAAIRLTEVVLLLISAWMTISVTAVRKVMPLMRDIIPSRRIS